MSGSLIQIAFAEIGVRYGLVSDCIPFFALLPTCKNRRQNSAGHCVEWVSVDNVPF